MPHPTIEELIEQRTAHLTAQIEELQKKTDATLIAKNEELQEEVDRLIRTKDLNEETIQQLTEELDGLKEQNRLREMNEELQGQGAPDVTENKEVPAPSALEEKKDEVAEEKAKKDEVVEDKKKKHNTK